MPPFQNEYTEFYVNQVQNGTLDIADLQAYDQAVQNSIQQIGDDDGRDTKIHQSIIEAITTVTSH
ncbi:MAG: hypothetical protein E6J34_24405 [Chloroflexi bacterium]|nr:MAG: hypothetical protein E6J34_24405 [Chloroflexota bacterium]